MTNTIKFRKVKLEAGHPLYGASCSICRESATLLVDDSSYCDQCDPEAILRIRTQLAELTDLRQTFDLIWAADRRATKRWQEAHPGNDLVWPDKTELCVWLLEQLDGEQNSHDAEIRRIAVALGLIQSNPTIEDIVSAIKALRKE